MAKKEKPQSLFRRLTRLFRSGPVIKKKIRTADTTIAVADKTKSSGTLLFQKSLAPTYATITANAYNLSERLMRYQDFQEMEYTPEIAAALDIYADETVAADEKGRCLHVYSDNEKIKEILEDLFYNTLNVEFNLRSWARNLVKYGDFFLYNDVSPHYGVVSAFPIPVNEVEREENYDREDPFAVRYRWVTLGNRVLENWEVTHFRLLGNDMFLPYGSSVIEPARRIWRQLILIEDAMLVYRVVRAPERRVFYIDVANVPAENVPMYVEEQRKNLRTNQVVDRSSGRVDLRYNPLPVHKDTPIPLLDGSTMTIENLAKKMKEEPHWTPWVYSVQDETMKIVPGKVTWCDKNYTATKLVKVWFDDGSYVMTAPEHPFVMRDGSKCRADELFQGDSIMSAYRDLSNRGYERVIEPDGKRVSTHVMVARDVYEEKWANTHQPVVHHKHPEIGEKNKRNNTPDNLEVMNFWEHRKMHSQYCELTLNTPERLAARAIKMAEYNKTIEHRIRTSEVNRRDCKAQRMCESYNGTELHKTHNEIRRQCQHESWSVSKQKRSDAMRLIIPNDILSSIFDIIKLNPTISRNDLSDVVRNNQDIINEIKKANSCNKRNVEKFHVNAIIAKLKRMGVSINGFSDFKKYVINNNAPVNHQVTMIENLTSVGEDVYCMTVVGSNGENDRHNFAVNGLDASQPDADNVKSLLFVWNSVDEDYFIPIRGNDSGTKIETLAGGANTAAVEDVAYIQKKLFAALKIPRAYLGYDEMLSSKATLAQEDIRFSRTINVVQKVMLAELNKLAIIHLYAHGFDQDDLQNFTLRLSNPSTVAQQQKLELWRSKFEIGGSAPEGYVDKDFIRKEIWGLNDEECKRIDAARLSDKMVDGKIEAAAAPGGEGAEGGGGDDLFGGAGGEEAGGAEAAGGAEEAPPPENAGEEPAEETSPEVELLTSADEADSNETFGLKLSLKDTEVPVKANRQLDRALYNNSRKRTHGASKTHMPDFNKMTNNDSHSMNDPYDSDWLKSVVSNPFGESIDHRSASRPNLPSDLLSSLNKWSAHHGLTPQSSRAGILSEESIIVELNEDDDVFIDSGDEDEFSPPSRGH